MSYHHKIKPAELVLVDCDPNADAVLLRALYRLWPEGKFDASSISGNRWNQPPLKLALRFLDPKYGPGGYLTERATQRVRRWIDAVENRPAGGLMLVRDRIGWCDIVKVAACGTGDDAGGSRPGAGRRGIRRRGRRGR